MHEGFPWSTAKLTLQQGHGIEWDDQRIDVCSAIGHCSKDGKCKVNVRMRKRRRVVFDNVKVYVMACKTARINRRQKWSMSHIFLGNDNQFG